MVIQTGTAQKTGRDGVNYLVSFIGFAPVEDPQLVIYCVVDEPNAQEQYHSTFAQNIVREILEEVLPYMNIYRDEESTGIHAGWDVTGQDTGQSAMTDVVNMVEEPVEDGLTDVPDTTDELQPSEEEGTVDVTVPVTDTGQADATEPVTDTGPEDAGTTDMDTGQNDAGTPNTDTGQTTGDMPPAVTDEPIDNNE